MLSSTVHFGLGNLLPVRVIRPQSHVKLTLSKFSILQNRENSKFRAPRQP
jgi:hypothetical protein